MPKFNVDLTRAITYTCNVTIEAETEDEAAEKAVALGNQVKDAQEGDPPVNDDAGQPIAFTEIQDDEVDIDEITESEE
jgi:hypothetical protein